MQLSDQGARQTSLTFADIVYDEPIPSPPVMPRRRETLQLSPKSARKTSLTFAKEVYDEPKPLPPVMPQRRETLQLSPKSAARTFTSLSSQDDGNPGSEDKTVSIEKISMPSRVPLSSEASTQPKVVGILKKSSRSKVGTASSTLPVAIGNSTGILKAGKWSSN